MKALILMMAGAMGVYLGACDAGSFQKEDTSVPPADCGDLPHPCVDTCLTGVDGFTKEANCCADVTCNCNPQTHLWEVYVCTGP